MGKLVSIIIPVYNTKEFISICLESLYKQSYTDFEVILINDGSDKACTEELEVLSSRDDRIRLYHLKENHGPGFARNFGMKKAAGEYLYFLDSDDYLPPETLQLLIENIGNQPLIVGNIRYTYLSKGFTVTFPGLIKPVLYKEGRLNLVNKRSVLNTLVKRSFVEKHKLAFTDQNIIYSDISFMIPLVMKAKIVPYVKEAIYFKRKRNDPINNPSLRQSNKSKIALEYLKMYQESKDSFKKRQVQNYLDKQLLNFYRKSIVSYYNNGLPAEEIFEELHNAIQRVQDKYIEKSGFILKRDLKAVKQNNLGKYKRNIGQHQFLRDLKTGMESKNKFRKFLYKHIFLRMPIKDDLVVFESFFGKSYSDNPKYIYQYLSEHHPEYKAVWSVKEPLNIPGKPKQVERLGLKYLYYMARAKYWVSNSRLPKYLKVRDGGVFLQTWHGTPLKKLVFDMNDVYSADPKYKENFYIQSRRWDYLNSANQYSSDVFRKAFMYEKPLLEYGYPRNDILYQKNNPEDILKLKKKMNIPVDKKVVLYAPTWRDDDYVAKGQYNFNLELDLEVMRNRLGSEYIVILRTHYFISEQLNIEAFKGFAYNFSTYDDIAELYLVSDILITDYSSVFFDYANLKRPILFFTFDLESYKDQIRGLYLDIERELPGPLLMTSDEVIDTVEQIDKVKAEYKGKYDEFYERFCSWDDGRASEKTVQTVFLEK